MLYDVVHLTEFAYARTVALSQHRLHLGPRPAPNQTCRRTRLVIRPDAVIDQTTLDYFGNPTLYLTVEAPHDRLSIRAESVVEVRPRPPLDPAATAPWEAVRDEAAGGGALLEVAEFVHDSPFTTGDAAGRAALGAYARPSFPAGRPVLAGAADLMRRLRADLAYDGAATDVTTAAHRAFAARRGVCQDFAHVMIAALRGLGLPARYVSGYLRTRRHADPESLRGADASHAWVAVWCPGAGWADLDPTNNVAPDADHVTLAWGRDYGDVSPVAGVITGGGRQTMRVAVAVTPRTEAAGTAEAAAARG